MRRTCRKVARNAPVWLTVIFFLAALITDIGQGRQQATQRRSDKGYNPKIKIGEFPPDFELPTLTLKTDETGKPFGVISEKDTVRLSSFRGKKPVCLIMSSYT